MRHPLFIRGIVFVCLLVAFMIWTFLITNAGVDQGTEHATRVFQTTVGTIAGPLTGAISRGFQGCCLAFSLYLMTFCAPALLLGVLAQLVPMPDRVWARATRLVLWVAGWVVWFMGGIVSFLHALN